MNSGVFDDEYKNNSTAVVSIRELQKGKKKKGQKCVRL